MEVFGRADRWEPGVNCAWQPLLSHTFVELEAQRLKTRLRGL
jgi:hypothetical protein